MRRTNPNTKPNPRWARRTNPNPNPNANPNPKPKPKPKPNPNPNPNKGAPHWFGERLAAAVADGSVSKASVRQAAQRVLGPVLRLGGPR